MQKVFFSFFNVLSNFLPAIPLGQLQDKWAGTPRWLSTNICYKSLIVLWKCEINTGTVEMSFGIFVGFMVKGEVKLSEWLIAMFHYICYRCMIWKHSMELGKSIDSSCFPLHHNELFGICHFLCNVL